MAQERCGIIGSYYIFVHDGELGAVAGQMAAESKRFSIQREVRKGLLTQLEARHAHVGDTRVTGRRLHWHGCFIA
jgi:hypothetical protein